MKRSRSNRRKAEARRVKLPRIRINLHWLVLPPAALAALAIVFVAAQAALGLPVDKLEIEGRFQRVTPLQVEEAVTAVLDRGFLAVDLRLVRRAVEALDWVDAAELTRIWPDTLVIRIVEQQAAARWGETDLLNVRGELFSSDRHNSLPELPMLSGPRGSQHVVAARYLVLRDRLSASNLSLRGLAMDERGAWRIDLESGQQIRLGKDDVGSRIDRFFALVLPALDGEFDRVSYIDMRYTNGFAVAWLDDLELSRTSLSEVLSSG